MLLPIKKYVSAMPLISETYVGSFYPFTKLSKRRLNYFIRLGEVKKYKTDEIIYNEGDPSDYFYLLLKGRVLALSFYKGESVPIELIKKGTSFGIISLFTGERHSVTTRAIEDSLVLQIEKDTFKKFLEKNPLLAIDFSEILSRRVKKRVNAPKRIFSSRTICFLHRTAGEESFEYLRYLVESIVRETGKKVIVVEWDNEGSSFINKYISREVTTLSLEGIYSDEDIEKYFVIDSGVYYLLCRVKDENYSRIHSLNNFLAENFHFIFYFLQKHQWDIVKLIYPSFSELQFFVGMGDEAVFSSWVKDVVSFSHQRSLKEKIKVVAGRGVNVRKGMFAGYPVEINLSYEKEDSLRRIRYLSRRLGEVAVGLALGSGGAYGFAHLGVLKALNSYGVEIDMVCGSSIGAVVAALWAVDTPLDEIKEHIRYFGRKIREISIVRLSIPRRGVVKSRHLEGIIRDILGDKRFSDTKRTLGVVAFSFRTRSIKVFREGYLYKAVAASCAMPGVFEPVTVKGEPYLDGGVLSPVPADVLLREGIKKIIAVNVTPSREDVLKSLQKRRIFNIFDFVFGSIETMQRRIMQEALEAADIVIHPDMAGYNWAAFDHFSELMRKGEEATLRKIDEIKELVSR